MCLVQISCRADVDGVKRTAAGIALTTLTLCLALPASAADKVTICHAAGLAGSTQFATLTIPTPALSGHFDNNGTPLAGHEEDFFGFCPGDNDPEAIDPAVVVTETTILPFDQVMPAATTTPTDADLGGDVAVTGLSGEMPSQVGGLTVAGSIPSVDPSLTSGMTVNGGRKIASPAPALTELPFTGASTGSLAVLAFGLVTAGIGLLRLNRSTRELNIGLAV